ncbi:ABC transporter permease [Tissierella sp. MB52-C2]|uniref:ABC transporter permease n=1 Tax=Tissierella sp. MB52-C2 TaxID=3070999 RepID=UPI00280BC78B|nr:ABC transporter permease [Tissierella sp. MB52-C2]WMM26365.1 ABC transporter permease [Tissierella sp. MB52-C2]
MMQLMRLELKKYKLQYHIIGVVIAILLIMAFITISLVDSMTDPTQTKDTYESTFMAINLLITVIFLVYSSVLISKIVISEYNNKTIMILFCYPLSRKKLMITKLLMVSIFTIIAMTISYLCCTFYLIGIDYFFDMVQGTFNISYLNPYITEAVTSIVMSGVLSLIPFVIGMQKKSVPVTIVSSLLVIFLRQVIITKNMGYRETLPQLIIVVILTLIAVKYTFYKKVNELDNL